MGIVALALVASSCGGSDDNAGTGETPDDPAREVTLEYETGPLGEPTEDGSPVDGGTMRVAVAVDPGGLDPVKSSGDGATGLTELASIYDLLLRYDFETNEYVPHLAESLTANDDATQYTLKLRPSVNFTDGTPLNAAAVKSSIERFSGPDSLQIYYNGFLDLASIETPDDLTVVFTLNSTDRTFPWLFAQAPGMIVSPAAVEAKGAEAFNKDPVGAGPFMVDTYTPGSGLTVVANPDYWGEAPHLERIEFSWLSQDQAKNEALNNGDVDVIGLGSPDGVLDALKAGSSGFGSLRHGVPAVIMNTREGRPFEDVRLRKAVAYALDAEAINTRVFDGMGYPSKDLFAEGILKSGVPGIETSPEKAKQLVQEVKDSTGWDGSFTILANNESTMNQTALAVQAMLNNAGFDAEVETAPVGTSFVDSIYVKFEFDMAVSAATVTEANPRFYLAYEFMGDFAPSGYASPEMDAALAEMKAAATEDEVKDAIGRVQEVVNEDVPVVWLGMSLYADGLHKSNVHGVVPSTTGVLLLGQAWMTD